MKYNVWYLFTSLLIIFLHFSPFRIEDVSITLVFIFLPIWNISTFQFKNSIKKTIINFSVLALLVPWLNFKESNGLEFLKTYLLFFIFVIQIAILFNFKLKKNIEARLWKRWIIKLQYILISYSACQFFLLKYWNNGFLFNPWRTFQAFNEYRYFLFLKNIRSTGFYLEPSVLGLVIVVLFWMRHILSLSDSVRANIFITSIGLLFVNSLNAYISLIVIVLFYYRIRIKSKSIRNLFFVLLLFNIFIFYSYIPRIQEYAIDGSSTYWRFIAPVVILADLIPNNLIGMPFGSYQLVIESYGLQNGSSIGTSIDNGHLLLIYYFGLIVLFLYGVMFYFYKKSKHYVIKSYFIYLFLVFNFTGAVFNIEYAFLIFILPFVTIKMI